MVADLDQEGGEASNFQPSSTDFSIYEKLLFPLITKVDAERAHDRTIRALEWAQSSRPGRMLLRRIAGKIPSLPVDLWGLTFPNPLGVAAGFDKDVRIFPGLALLGFGHIEVGTLTPWPQAGNPRPRVFRLPHDRALINRMGFPNAGMVAAHQRLRRLKKAAGRAIIGVSLGKQKETPLERAIEDYVAVMRAVYPHADYLAVNISSPNTPDLRRLQSKHYLPDLLEQLMAESRNLAYLLRLAPRPVLVKIAPDLMESEVDQILTAVINTGVDGLIATNTTTSRECLSDPPEQQKTGGLSGVPLAARSTAMLSYISAQTGGKLPLVGVGGVFSAEDLQQKLAAGASLVQVYTGLVYRGPGMAGRLLRRRAAAAGVP